MNQTYTRTHRIHIDACSTGDKALIRDAMGPSMGCVAWDITVPCDGLAICTPSHEISDEQPFPDTKELPAVSADPAGSRRVSSYTPPSSAPDADASVPRVELKRQLRQVLRQRTDQLLDARTKHHANGGSGGGDQLDHHSTRSMRKGERP